MALFDLPKKRSSRTSDSKIANKATNILANKTITIKGSGTLADKIRAISLLVESKLGKYKDEYDVIRDEPQKLHDYITACIENNIVSIDTETTGLDPMQDEIVGFSLYTPGQKAVYVPINHISYVTQIKSSNQISVSVVTDEFLRLADESVRIVMFNAPFDIRVIWNHIKVRLHCWFDCYIATKCLNENEPSNALKVLYEKYIQDNKSTAWTFGKLFENIPFALIPIKDAYIYGARDAKVTFEYFEFQLPFLELTNEKCKIHQLEGVSNIFWNIEMKSMDAFIDMEQTGIALDFDYSKKLSERYHNYVDLSNKNINKELAKLSPIIDSFRRSHPNCKLEDPINIGSTKQLSCLLYDILNIGIVDEKNPRGVGKEILEKIDHPLCKAILEQRKLEKLLSTYIDKMPTIANPNDGRVHCKFNQYGAKTGRTSSNDPNMQNIPSRPWKLIDGTKIDAGHDVRQMFCASPGNILISCDYSAQEPRLTAHLSHDEKMVQAYRDNKDVYSEIASISFNKTYEECLEFMLDENGNKTDIVNPEGKERRSAAKKIVLGINYGMHMSTIASELHCEVQKAEQIYNDVLDKFVGLRAFKDDSEAFARKYGYVTTVWGRKRRLPEMQLPYYEFKYKDGQVPIDFDPLADSEENFSTDVPEDICEKYTQKLLNAKYWKGKLNAKYWKEKRKIKDELNNMGIDVIDNTRTIDETTRQVVNARVQGSAADLTKLAMIELYNNQELRDLGFKMLIPIHDEILAECPRENAKRCGELMEKMMIDAARDLIVPISCDAEYTEHWYGEPLEF